MNEQPKYTESRVKKDELDQFMTKFLEERDETALQYLKLFCQFAHVVDVFFYKKDLISEFVDFVRVLPDPVKEHMSECFLLSVAFEGEIKRLQEKGAD